MDKERDIGKGKVLKKNAFDIFANGSRHFP
jgi:hypothetical protein